MPKLTRWYIKFSLVYLLAALLIAVMLAGRTLWTLPAVLAALSPVYFHLFMVGWVSELIIGVVFWLFPTLTSEKKRGNEALAWAVFWMLNAGLLLRVISEPVLTSAPWAGGVLAVSAVLQWLAGMGFVYLTWGRVRPPRRRRKS
ncbi:MAG TPA: hypothetical protein EYP88_01070 [Anaerolineales bacterium]|nr:hypothetical protein [Anaerolineales bacterium]